MFKSFGPLEIFLVLLILLVIFGAGRLPEIGKGLGNAMRGFKDALSGKDEPAPKAKVDAAASTVAPTAQPSDKKPSA